MDINRLKCWSISSRYRLYENFKRERQLSKSKFSQSYFRYSYVWIENPEFPGTWFSSHYI